MIRRTVDFALNNRLLIVGVALLLFVWGAVSFRNIPVETVLNGIPHLEHLRSVSLFGLSSLMLIFDDESENEWNREKVLERLSQVTLPPTVQPQMGTDWSPVGQIFFFTLHSSNP